MTANAIILQYEAVWPSSKHLSSCMGLFFHCFFIHLFALDLDRRISLIFPPLLPLPRLLLTSFFCDQGQLTLIASSCVFGAGVAEVVWLRCRRLCPRAVLCAVAGCEQNKLRRYIGYCPQEDALLDLLTVSGEE